MRPSWSVCIASLARVEWRGILERLHPANHCYIYVVSNLSSCSPLLSLSSSFIDVRQMKAGASTRPFIPAFTARRLICLDRGRRAGSLIELRATQLLPPSSRITSSVNKSEESRDSSVLELQSSISVHSRLSPGICHPSCASCGGNPSRKSRLFRSSERLTPKS